MNNNNLNNSNLIKHLFLNRIVASKFQNKIRDLSIAKISELSNEE